MTSVSSTLIGSETNSHRHAVSAPAGSVTDCVPFVLFYFSKQIFTRYFNSSIERDHVLIPAVGSVLCSFL